MIRFRNPGSDLDTMIAVLKQLYHELHEKDFFDKITEIHFEGPGHGREGADSRGKGGRRRDGERQTEAERNRRCMDFRAGFGKWIF